MANAAPRDYKKPAIDQRIAELLKRRIGAREDLPTESTKERLAKFKENRQAREILLTATHWQVLETAAYILNTNVEILEGGVLDKDEYVNAFSSFFNENGRKAILIYFQPMSPPPFESGRWVPQLSEEQEVIRCCITDGTTEEFTGKCVIVYRLKSNLEFGVKELLDEAYYAYAEVDPTSKSALAGISDLISRLHVRTLTANTQWGELTKMETGDRIRDNFVGDFKDFCEFLSMTKIDLESIMLFHVNWDLYLKHLKQPENIKESVHDPDVITAAENNLQMWMKTMERAIVESQQLRRETETVGPSAELAYWRRLLARFSSIMSHIKSPHTQSFIRFLTEAKSKLLKVHRVNT